MSQEINLTLVNNHLQQLLVKRQYPKTLCPSEAARAMSNAELAETGVTNWRDIMTPLRRYVFELRDQGHLEILQKGNVLPRTQSLEDTVGPIRLRNVQDP